MFVANAAQDEGVLIRRVNQLYHELTQDSFEHVHRHRFRIQKRFWEKVGRLVLTRERSYSAGCGDRVASMPRTVVDLACGSGFVTRVLGGYLGCRDRLIATDLGEGQLRTTGRQWQAFCGRRTEVPRLARLGGDVQNLPLHAASCDLVTLNAGLHHVTDAGAALGEIDRILRPGGFFALGFEPNRAHFASPVFYGMSRGLDRLCWYASLRQNGRRLREGLGRLCGRAVRADASYETLLAGRMNEQLMREGLVDRPLGVSRLLDLVDTHARGEDKHAGFDPCRLLGEALPDYQVFLLNTSDYLGEIGRFWPPVRSLSDALLRTIAPGHGSLFSWLVRKPEAGL
jgi:SAM-dependent methyltransferase